MTMMLIDALRLKSARVTEIDEDIHCIRVEEDDSVNDILIPVSHKACKELATLYREAETNHEYVVVKVSIVIEIL